MQQLGYPSESEANIDAAWEHVREAIALLRDVEDARDMLVHLVQVSAELRVLVESGRS